MNPASFEYAPNLPDVTGLLPGANVWWVVAAVLLVFAIVSLIIVYHWLRYSVGSFVMLLSVVAYFGVSALLLGTILVSAAAVSPAPTLPFDLPFTPIL